MRRISLAIVAAAAVGLLALAQPPVAHTPNWRDAIVDTVKVVRNDGAGGTGVPISCTPTGRGSWSVVILTAAHVVRGADLTQWSIETPDRWYGVPTLIAQHDSKDAALLRVMTNGPIPCTPLRFDAIDAGEHVWVIGYPALVDHRVITDGWVGGPGCASAEVFPGNSGGPVVDSHGHLVGIVLTVGVHGSPMNRKFIHHDMGFLPMGEIQEWLASNL